MIFISLGLRVGVKTPCLVTNDYCGVIGVGGKHIVTAQFVGVFNHLEQAAILIDTVDCPGGIKDFVAAVF